MRLFYIVWALWFISELVLRRIKKSKIEKNETDKGTMNIIWVAILFGISVAILILYQINIPFSKDLSLPIIGLGIIILGIIIRFWSIIFLGKSFTVNLATYDNQVLQTKNIYKFIRHPSYLGSLISFIGLGLSFNNILSFFALLIPIVFAFLYRIKIEEKVLTEKFGNEYIEYKKKTKKLIPFVF